MIRLAVLTEGRTERRFVRLVLISHLRPKGIEACPLLLEGGGDVTLPKLARNMAELYWSFDFVTSLVDFYGFRSKGDATPDELQQRINQEIRRNIRRDWNQSKVFPYVQRHEFESLLFSDVSAFKDLSPKVPKESVEKLHAIRNQFSTPEDINDDKSTAPSKRILGLIPRYQKRRDGPKLAGRIGLEAIRGECPRFDGWLTRLESLGDG